MGKRCNGCKKVLPSKDFNRSSRNKDGLDSRCRSCKAAYYAANRDEIKRKARDHYSRTSGARREQKSEYYRENRDSITSRRRKAWKEEPSIKANRDAYVAAKKAACYSMLGGSCVRCSADDHDVLVIDHVHDDGQEERGSGKSLIRIRNRILETGNEDGRYQLLCFNCNLKKAVVRAAQAAWEPTGVRKTCPTCDSDLDESFFKWYRAGEELYFECRSCSRSRDLALKVSAMALLGGAACNECKITDLDVLTVDHVRGDGGGSARTRSGVSMYRAILNGVVDKAVLQVLCLNCNVKKGSVPSKKAVPLSRVVAPSRRGRAVPVDLSSLRVLAIPSVDARKFLDKYHYAGCGRAGSLSFGSLTDGLLIAVAKLAPPVRKEVATSMGLKHSAVLELDRLCVRSGYNAKNLLSHFLSRVVKLVRATTSGVTVLVSFADPRFGHDGTAYRASNWEYVGKTAKSYSYLSPDGSEVHKKTLFDFAKRRGIAEREYADKAGYRRVHVPPKLKFVYRL